MKIRNGFVSNSSSSSFVIGIGKVKPDKVQQVQKILNKSQAREHDAYLMTYGDLLEKKSYSVKVTPKEIIVESFDGSEVRLSTDNLNNDDTIIILDGSGYHDDEDFTIYDANGNFEDMDYDIDLDFPEHINKVMALIYNTELVDHGTVRDGAGRDG